MVGRNCGQPHQGSGQMLWTIQGETRNGPLVMGTGLLNVAETLKVFCQCQFASSCNIAVFHLRTFVLDTGYHVCIAWRRVLQGAAEPVKRTDVNGLPARFEDPSYFGLAQEQLVVLARVATRFWFKQSSPMAEAVKALTKSGLTFRGTSHRDQEQALAHGLTGECLALKAAVPAAVIPLSLRGREHTG